MNYIQEYGLMDKIGNYIEGNKLLVLMGTHKAEEYQSKMKEVLPMAHEFLVCEMECTIENVEKIADKVNQENFDSILGFGGGKVIDIAKAVANTSSCFMAIMPTAASMDGAATDVSVLYNENHTFNCYLKLKKEPDVVLADSQIIFSAPYKMICSGMADALSTYFETKDYSLHHEVEENALRMSHICLYNVIDNYDDVKRAYKKGEINIEVENTIETILNYSAQAFMKTGSSVAHAFANATTRFKDSIGSHGERVAVGLRLLLLLEENNWIEDVDLFLKRMEMPKTLSQLHIKEDEILELASYIIKEESMKNAKEEYSVDDLVHALNMIQ